MVTRSSRVVAAILLFTSWESLRAQSSPPPTPWTQSSSEYMLTLGAGTQGSQSNQSPTATSSTVSGQQTFDQTKFDFTQFAYAYSYSSVADPFKLEGAIAQLSLQTASGPLGSISGSASTTTSWGMPAGTPADMLTLTPLTSQATLPPGPLNINFTVIGSLSCFGAPANNGIAEPEGANIAAVMGLSLGGSVNGSAVLTVENIGGNLVSGELAQGNLSLNGAVDWQSSAVLSPLRPWGPSPCSRQPRACQCSSSSRATRGSARPGSAFRWVLSSMPRRRSPTFLTLKRR